MWGKNKPRRQQNHARRRHETETWTVKPLHGHPPINEKLPNCDQDQDQTQDAAVKQQPETSPSSNYKPSRGRNRRWASKNRGARVEKPDTGSKTEVGGSSNGERDGGQVVDERESEGISGGVEESDKEVVVAAVEDKEEVVVVEEGDCSGGSGGGGGGVDDGGGGDGGDDVLRRLEELKVGVEEVELSEEEVKINDQLQEDELLAMESIYGDRVYTLEKREGLRCFQLHLDIELPSQYPVLAKLKTATHSNSEADVSDEFTYNFSVQYLPPIMLTCLLPRSYPSRCPPLFTISVKWLHESSISKLCSELDTLWNEQPGQEILYQWVEWLHSSTLPHLGFDEELVLGPYDMERGSDRRAFSGSVSPDVDIPSLKSYNKERLHENFLNGFHRCCICFSEYAGTEFLRLPCDHFFCAKCLKTYASVHVKEGTVNKLQCPDTKCGGMIPPGLLKLVLGDEEFERWESLMLQKTLDAMSDVAYCPRCETACLEDEDEHAQCSKCFFSFCTLCMERRHVGIECMTPEMKLKALKDRQNSSNLKAEQRAKERELINEILSLKEILRDAKQCPSCKIAISRIEGCNKMVCSNCSQYFCYRCNKAIDGYDHFRSSACELFPQQMVQAWEAQVNVRREIGQYLAANQNGKTKPCPICRQQNAKGGNNNHIFCWSCQNHYCYQCGKSVQRAAQHYVPSGCKQHSAD